MPTPASPSSPTTPSPACAGSSACPITETVEPWCYEATRDNIRHYAHGIGDDNPLWCDPGLRRRHPLRHDRGPAELRLRPRPRPVGLRGRAARHPRHVGRRRPHLAPADRARHRDPHPAPPEGPGRAPDRLRRPGLPADLPRRGLRHRGDTPAPAGTRGASAPSATPPASSARSTTRPRPGRRCATRPRTSSRSSTLYGAGDRAGGRAPLHRGRHRGRGAARRWPRAR